MICPHLKRTVMPICQAKKGELMTPNVYELQNYCISLKYKICPVFKEIQSREKAEKKKKAPDKDAIT
ncbi:MAG: hypothetical protein JSW70_06865 [Syntrophobacterales bacterium]|nr:MAG: hypothetical protein JSW70_06865 [Syntrophobacterales bacterium]